MRKTANTTRGAITLVIPFLLLCASEVSAQMERQMARGQQENQTLLMKYEWKSRLEILKDNETKKVQLALMRYDVNGQAQKTILSSTPEPNLPKFGLRKAVAQKKVADFRETLEALSALARSYSEIPPDRMQRFLNNASVSPELTASARLVRIEGRDILQPGDAMTIFLDAVSRKQRRIEIQTTLDQKPVRIISEFRDLPQGPTYLARSQVSYSGNSIIIITENFDYTRIQ